MGAIYPQSEVQFALLLIYYTDIDMEIHQTAPTGVALKFSEGIVAVNPPDNKKGPMPAIILSTYPVPVGGWMSAFATEGEEQVHFHTAGEYEKNNIYIRGFGTETTVQGMRVQTTSWCIDAEGMRIVILGDIAERKEAMQVVSEVNDIDVLIAFCGTTKDKRLDATGIAGIAAEAQAQRIVPIGDNDTLKKKLAKEFGATEEITGKYVLKKKTLLEGKASVILFI